VGAGERILTGFFEARGKPTSLMIYAGEGHSIHELESTAIRNNSFRSEKNAA
jgi:hypothetical protein